MQTFVGLFVSPQATEKLVGSSAAFVGTSEECVCVCGGGGAGGHVCVRKGIMPIYMYVCIR